jgi:hypothetical protein
MACCFLVPDGRLFTQVMAASGSFWAQAEAMELAEKVFYAKTFEDAGVRISGYDLKFDFTPEGKPAFTKERKLTGPNVEKILAEFYVRDPVQALQTYFYNITKQSELARRFGAKGEKFQKLKEMARDEGKLDAFGEALETLVPLVGGQGKAMGRAWRPLHSLLLTWNTLGTMKRAAFSSLAEPWNIGMRSHSVKNAVKGMGQSFKYAAKIVKGDKDEAIRLTEGLGLISRSLDDGINVSNMLGDTAGSKTLREVQGKFHQRIFLEQLTSGQRVASVNIGKGFIAEVLTDLNRPKWKASAQRYLRELGIAEGDFAAMQNFAAKLKASSDPDALIMGNTPEAAMYRKALVRFANQSIMESTAATRSAAHSTPLGQIVFSLQGYLSAFHENVIKRDVRLIREAATGSDMSAQERLHMLTPVAMLIPYIGIVGLLNELREEIWPTLTGKDKTPERKVGEAISRASLAGRYDPLLNAVASLKYEKDPATTLLGATLGRPSEFGAAAIKFAMDNSEETNKAERNLAGKTYDNLVAPAANMGAALMPGAIGKVAAPAIIQAVGHTQTKENLFVEPLAGEKQDTRGTPMERGSNRANSSRAQSNRANSGR